jgi:REP element-mobilizing transposase RayT
MSETGWRSRGYLPHCDQRGLVQHLVFGLADAMPRSVPSFISVPTARAKWADKVFDRGYGSRMLARSANAGIVEQALLHGDGQRYILIAWCVMPTHVHAVIEPLPTFSLEKIVHGWKSFTAHEINKREGRDGTLWRREYFDRFMRSPEQFDWTIAYVENNPVKARLAEKPEDWQFSSARHRR